MRLSLDSFNEIEDIKYLSGLDPYGVHDFQVEDFKKNWGSGIGLLHQHRTEDVVLFYGLGWAVDVAEYSSTWWSVYEYSEGPFLSGNVYYHKAEGYGAEAYLGAEWWAFDWLSIHAEYSSRVWYLHETRSSSRLAEGGSISDREQTVRQGWSYMPMPVRFGISLHF